MLEQLPRPVDGSRTDPAVIGVYVDVAAAHDGDCVPTGEAVTVFEDRRDAERGRRFDDEASVVEDHPHASDDRRLLDQDGVVSDREEAVQDGRDGTPAGDAVSDGAGRRRKADMRVAYGALAVAMTRRTSPKISRERTPSSWNERSAGSSPGPVVTGRAPCVPWTGTLLRLGGL